MTLRDSHSPRQHEHMTSPLTGKVGPTFPDSIPSLGGFNKFHKCRDFSTSSHSHCGRSVPTAMSSGSLLSHTNGSHGVRCRSSSHSSSIAATNSSEMIRPFIGTWILQPALCQYEFGDPPISGKYTIEAMTDLSDDEDGEGEGENNGDATTTTAVTHELRFILEWKERPRELLTTTDLEKVFRTEITEAITGRWHKYYGSGAPNEFAIDEVSLGLEMSMSSAGDGRDIGGDSGGEMILVSYGRRGGKLVTSTERQMDFSKNQLIVRQSYYVDKEFEEESESESAETRMKKRKKKFTNVSYFVREY